MTHTITFKSATVGGTATSGVGKQTKGGSSIQRRRPFLISSGLSSESSSSSEDEENEKVVETVSTVSKPGTSFTSLKGDGGAVDESLAVSGVVSKESPDKNEKKKTTPSAAATTTTATTTTTTPTKKSKKSSQKETAKLEGEGSDDYEAFVKKDKSSTKGRSSGPKELSSDGGEGKGTTGSSLKSSIGGGKDLSPTKGSTRKAEVGELKISVSDDGIYDVPSVNVLNWARLPKGYIVSHSIKLFAETLYERCMIFRALRDSFPDLISVDDGLSPEELILLKIFMAIWTTPQDFPNLLVKYESLLNFHRLRGFHASWIQANQVTSSVQCVGNRLTMSMTKADFLLVVNTFHELLMVPYRLSYDDQFSAVQEFRKKIQEAEHVRVAYYIKQWTPRQVFTFLLRWFTYKTNDNEFDHIPERLLRWIEIDLDFDGNLNDLPSQTHYLLQENPEVLAKRLDQSVIGSENFRILYHRIVNEEGVFDRWRKSTFDRLLELIKF